MAKGRGGKDDPRERDKGTGTDTPTDPNQGLSPAQIAAQQQYANAAALGGARPNLFGAANRGWQYSRGRFEAAMRNYDQIMAAGPSHPLYQDLVRGANQYWQDVGLASERGGAGAGFYDRRAAQEYARERWGESGFTNRDETTASKQQAAARDPVWGTMVAEQGNLTGYERTGPDIGSVAGTTTSEDGTVTLSEETRALMREMGIDPDTIDLSTYGTGEQRVATTYEGNAVPTRRMVNGIPVYEYGGEVIDEATYNDILDAQSAMNQQRARRDVFTDPLYRAEGGAYQFRNPYTGQLETVWEGDNQTFKYNGQVISAEERNRVAALQGAYDTLYNTEIPQFESSTDRMRREYQQRAARQQLLSYYQSQGTSPADSTTPTPTTQNPGTPADSETQAPAGRMATQTTNNRPFVGNRQAQQNSTTQTQSQRMGVSGNIRHMPFGG